jgi:hypothetical protein
VSTVVHKAGVSEKVLSGQMRRAGFVFVGSVTQDIEFLICEQSG